MSEYLFSSAHRSLSAQGVLTRVELPAVEGDRPDSAFQQAVQRAFALAREAGQTDPIVLGALPFDARQPSCLVVPVSHRFLSREAVMASHQRQVLHPQVVGTRSLPDAAGFKQGVRQAIANFQHSSIRKVVLSRLCQVDLGVPLDGGAVLANLLMQNPVAYHFRLPLAGDAELIGASPELLLRQEGDRVWTFPLAGTAARRPDPDQDQAVAERLLASVKDQHEHHLVVEDIRQRLGPLCDPLHIPDAPELVATPTLWHLGTPMEGRLRSPALGSLALACRLHPTPAVCGVPRQQARKLVDLIEPFERGPFSGVVGWCDSRGNGEWVVSIRCATLQPRLLQLFAGVGVVEASCPEAEWAETQAKLRTMLHACGLNPEVLS